MDIDYVEVMHGTQYDKAFLVGPMVGVRLGDVVAYEYELPEKFTPRAGRTRIQRTYTLLDVGVSLSNPCWARRTDADGSVVEIAAREQASWYVDLIAIERQGTRYVLRDLFVDVIIPTDGRPYRQLDLEEYGDALESGVMTVAEAVDGLRRWQSFLERYVHSARWPVQGWTDFPPRAIQALQALAEPLAELVRWPD